MKFILTRYWYFILFILFALLVRINENNQAFRGYLSSDHKQFSKTLVEKEKLLDSYLDSIWTYEQDGIFFDYIVQNKGLFKELFDKHGLIFYLFNKQDLELWTDNSLVLPDSILDASKGFVELENAFVELRKRSYGDKTLIGLILIKYNFPYENDFLQNDFHKALKLSAAIDISEGEVSGGHPVFSKEGEKLFYLNESVESIGLKEDRLTLVFLALMLLFLFLYLHRLHVKVNFTPRYFIIFSIVFIGLRIVLQWQKFPQLLYAYPLFSAEPFALSTWFPSLGELLISSVLWGYLIFVFHTKVALGTNFVGPKNKSWVLLIWFFVLVFVTLALFYLLRQLTLNGNYQMEMFRLTDLSGYSLVAYLIISINIFAFLLLLDKCIMQLKSFLSLKQLFYFLGLVVLLISVLYFFSSYHLPYISIIFLALLFAFFANHRYKHAFSFRLILLVLVLFSTYITLYVSQLSLEKRLEQSKVKAVSLSYARDLISEVLLGDVMSQIGDDKKVEQYLDSTWFDFDALLKHIDDKYFVGYLSKYYLQLTVCNNTDSVIIANPDEQWYYCYGFFEELIQNNGVETNIPDLYLLQSDQGDVEYFMQVPKELPLTKESVNLYISIISKPNFEVLGYPELLITDNIDETPHFTGLSYVKYSGNKLVTQVGDYPYAFDRSIYENFDEEFAYFKRKKHHHMLLNTTDNHTILVSHPVVQPFNILISFTYLFFFFLSIVALFLLFGRNYFDVLRFQLTIKNKIIVSMASVFVVSLILVSVAVIYYSYQRFELNKSGLLTEKIQSVLVELEHKLGHVDDLEEMSPEYISSLLVKFSNVFFTDINLYDLSGSLIASSRNEIFQRNLSSSYINAYAYRELLVEKNARFVHDERIGKLNYYAAYMPFRNDKHEILAYLNLPYFSKEKIIRQELQRVVVAVLNILVILIFVSVLIAVYLSNRLTKPLRMVQQRLRGIDLNHTNEKIYYKGNDEIADLVDEYNRMLEALSLSVQKLAKSERESAWRQMAKQVAHEIKNPLTPMKLNVQLLERSWENKDEDFDERFKKASNSLIEQIDSLSAIASAFSQFNRMQVSKLAKVDLVDKAGTSAQTFSNYKKVNIQLSNKYPEIFVHADGDQLLQVFNNLFKNAIQSMPKGQQGEIKVDFQLENSNVVVTVKDNGSGIKPEMKDQLFVPNFTTKTGGAGLGLVIVKNIIEGFNGEIWFESVLGEGTAFYISLPLYKEKE